MDSIAILDYGAGNLTSVERAVRHLGFPCRVTTDRREVRAAGRLIFPGVGAARASMENLRRLGLDEELRRAVEEGKPVLGICIGCQVIFEKSEEDGGTPCLGILPGRVVRFAFPSGSGLKVPHMGWNEVLFEREHPLLAGLHPPDPQGPPLFYFVHGYYPWPSSEGPSSEGRPSGRRPADGMVLGWTEYGGVRFPAMVGRGSLVAVQFHAEKSGRTGLRLLQNFLSWSPACSPSA